MIMPRHAPPGAYVDDPAEKLDRSANEQPSVFTLAEPRHDPHQGMGCAGQSQAKGFAP